MQVCVPYSAVDQLMLQLRQRMSDELFTGPEKQRITVAFAELKTLLEDYLRLADDAISQLSPAVYLYA